MNHQKISQAVEHICSTGCISVNATIEALESNHPVESLSDFSEDEIQTLTRELKSIMNVYKNKAETLPTSPNTK